MKTMIGIVTGLFILSGIFSPPLIPIEKGDQEKPPLSPGPGIEKLLERLESRYDYEHAPGTLEEAFRKRGVTRKKVLGYAKPWGENGLYLQWSRLVGNRTGTTREYLLKVEGILKERVKLLAEKAYWLDRKYTAWEEQKKIRDRYWKLWERNPTEYHRRYKTFNNRKNKELRPWKIKEAEAEKNANGVWKSDRPRKEKNGSESPGKKPGERTGKAWKLNPPSRFDRDGDGRFDPLPKR